MARLPLSWLLPAVALHLFSGSVSGGSADQDPKPPEAAWQPMFDGATLKGWRPTPFSGQGQVRVKDGTIVLGAGSMTGITWTNPFPSRIMRSASKRPEWKAAISLPHHVSGQGRVLLLDQWRLGWPGCRAVEPGRQRRIRERYLNRAGF
jgi:hypothetical protein